MTRSHTRAMGLLATLLCTGMASARQQPEATAPLPAPPPERPVTVSISIRGEIGFQSDFTDTPGSVSILRAGGDVRVGIPVGQYAQLNLGLAYEHSRYEFENATGFPSGAVAPFDNIDRETLSARFSKHLSQEWSFFVGGSATLAAESGAELGDSLEGLVYAAPLYAFSESLSMGVGVAVASRMEDNALVLPLIVVDWTFAEHWNLSNDGLGAVLTYTPDETWAFSLGATYSSRDFRLDDQGPIPGGVGRDTRIPVLFTAAFTPTRQVSIEAGLGVNLAQNIEVLNSNGDSVADLDADAAPFVTLKLGIRF